MATQSLAIETEQQQQTGEWQNATPPTSEIDERARKLVDNWSSACAKLADLHDEVEAIQEAFNGLKDDQEILGCKSFKVFCVRHLNRDPSTVYRMLKKAHFTLEPAPAHEEDTIFDQAIAIADQEAEDEHEDDEGEVDEEEGATTTKKKGGRRRIDMKAGTNAHYAERYLNMVGLLTNAPKNTPPEEIFATMQADAEAAYEDLDADLAKKIKIPKLVAVKPDPLIAENANLRERAEEKVGELELEIGDREAQIENLKTRIQALSTIPENLRDESITASLSAEPDSGIASTLLTAYLHSIVDRILPPSMTPWKVSAEVEIVGRDHRIVVGDFVEKRSREQKDAASILCKCTAIGECESRRRVREWVDGKWDREHVVFGNEERHYRVITEARARELAPSAFENQKSKRSCRNEHD